MKNLRFLYAIVALAVLSAPVFAQRGAPMPPTPQAMQDVANRIVQMVNSQNADGLTAMTAEGALYLDEDGHGIPASVWINKLTGTQKQMEISAVHGEVMGNTGWVSFNYTLGETFQGQNVALRGTASLVLQQTNGNWMIHMVHGALEQHVAGLTGD